MGVAREGEAGGEVRVQLWYWRCPRCGRILVEASFSRLRFEAENHCKRHGDVTFTNAKVIEVALP